MQSEKVGIEETKQAMEFLTSLANSIEDATRNGIDWKDSVKFIPPITKLIPAVMGSEKIGAELKDLDEEERAELINVIKDLDFDSKYSEKFAEQALRVLTEMAVLFSIKDRPVEPELVKAPEKATTK